MDSCRAMYIVKCLLYTLSTHYIRDHLYLPNTLPQGGSRLWLKCLAAPVVSSAYGIAMLLLTWTMSNTSVLALKRTKQGRGKISTSLFKHDNKMALIWKTGVDGPLGYRIAVCLSMAFIVVSSPAEGIVFGSSLSLVYTLWALLMWPWGPRSFPSGWARSQALIHKAQLLLQGKLHCYLGRFFFFFWLFLGVGTGVMRKGVT